VTVSVVDPVTPTSRHERTAGLKGVVVADWSSAAPFRLAGQSLGGLAKLEGPTHAS